MQEAQWVFNHSRFWEDKESLDGVRACLGQAPEDLVLTPPIYFDHGDRIFFGQSCYANTGLAILDAQEVRIGDQVLLGPHVSIYTANHPLDAEVQSTGLETARPVSIGDRVWIGGRVVINPGVSIGSDTVLASGSVVTKDVPSGVLYSFSLSFITVLARLAVL
ncbi:sugar O-acetyltransferase [Streptococcus mitis]|nr:sugar O-acetyltransferase [Streptococcus sp. NLN76]